MVAGKDHCPQVKMCCYFKEKKIKASKKVSTISWIKCFYSDSCGPVRECSDVPAQEKAIPPALRLRKKKKPAKVGRWNHQKMHHSPSYTSRRESASARGNFSTTLLKCVKKLSFFYLKKLKLHGPWCSVRVQQAM